MKTPLEEARAYVRKTRARILARPAPRATCPGCFSQIHEGAAKQGWCCDCYPIRNVFSKPLFIPLKTEYFEAFAAGTKRREFRLYGPRWNATTCRVGRLVVLSKGYGKKHRLSGEIVDFRKTWDQSPAFRACYPNARGALVASIEIEVDR